MPPIIVVIATFIAFEIKSKIYLAIVLYLINYAAAAYAKRNQPSDIDPADSRRHVSRSSISPMIRLYGKRRISGTLVY